MIQGSGDKSLWRSFNSERKKCIENEIWAKARITIQIKKPVALTCAKGLKLIISVCVCEAYDL